MAFWNRKKKEDEGEFITIKVRRRNLLPPYCIQSYEETYKVKYDAEKFLMDACNFGIARYTSYLLGDIRRQRGKEKEREKASEKSYEKFQSQLAEINRKRNEKLAQRVIELTKAGKSTREVGKELNIPHIKAYRLLKKYFSNEAEEPTHEEETLEALRKGDATSPFAMGLSAGHRRIPAGKVRVYVHETQSYICVPAKLARKIKSGGWKCWCPIFNEGEHRLFIAFAKEFSQVGRPLKNNSRSADTLRLQITRNEVEKIERCLDVKLPLRANNLVSHTPPKVDDKGLLRIYLQK